MPQTQSISHAIPDNIINNGPSEMFNFAVMAPPGVNGYDVTFGGDWSQEIGSQQLTQQFDPFCAAGDTCTPDVGVANGITVLTWYGPQIYENTQWGYHFGLASAPSGDAVVGCDPNDPNSTGTALAQCQLDADWIYPSQPHTESPFVGISWPHKHAAIKTWAFAEVYLSVSLKPNGPPAFMIWQDVPYAADGSKQPKLKFTNHGSQKLYVLSSGMIPDQPVPTDPDCVKNPGCAEDMAILATLNYAGAPPPGYPGSEFIRMTYPPAKVLKPTR